MRESVLDCGEGMLDGDPGCFPSQSAGCRRINDFE
jgi:hypothetical protein